MKTKIIAATALLAFLASLPSNIFAYATEYFYEIKGIKTEEGYLPAIREELENIDQQFIFFMPRRRGVEKSYGKVMIEPMDSFYGHIILTPYGSTRPREYHSFEMKLIVHDLTFINAKTGEEYPVFISRENRLYSGGEWLPLVDDSEFPLSYKEPEKVSEKKWKYSSSDDYTVYYRFPVPKEKHKKLTVKYHVSVSDASGAIQEFKDEVNLILKSNRPSLAETIP